MIAAAKAESPPIPEAEALKEESMKSDNEWLNNLDVVMHQAQWEQKDRNGRRINKAYGKIQPDFHFQTILLGWPFFLRLYCRFPDGQVFGIIWATSRLSRRHRPQTPRVWAFADIRMPGRSG